MKVITIFNNKGGVCKTSVAQHLACGLSAVGYKVLAIDLDEQRSLSLALGAKKSKLTSYEVLTNKCTIKEAILQAEEVAVVRGSADLNNLPNELKEKKSSLTILKNQLETIKKLFDYVIIDTAPSLNIISYNAIFASNEIIIPTEATTFSLIALQDMADTINTFKQANSKLKVRGVLLVKCSEKKKLNAQLSHLLEKGLNKLETQVFNSRIRNSSKVDSLQQKQLSCFKGAPNAPITQDFKKFINEFAKKPLFEINEE